jgi:hypothetical protein
MDDILAIAGIAATAAIVAGLARGLRWVLVDGDGSMTLASIQAESIGHDWPAGVQEEEPFRWHVEALTEAPPGRTLPTGALPRLTA